MPGLTECQSLADAVDALTAQEAAQRQAIAGLSGVDKWKAMLELGTIRQQLGDQQKRLSACQKQLASDLAIEVAVLDLPGTSGARRVARVWQLSASGQNVMQTVTLQDGVATFAAIPTNARQSFGITVEETDQSGINGPDFRFGPLPPVPPDSQTDPVGRIEIVILEPVVIAFDALGAAVPPLPIPFSYSAGLLGSINLAVTGLAFEVANGLISVSAVGTVAGATISSPFAFSASFHIAPTFGMAPNGILEVSGAAATLSVPGLVGALINELQTFLSPRLLSMTLPALNTCLNKLAVDGVAAALGLNALPSGSVLSVRQVTIDAKVSLNK
jgi:hypothetical protein